MHEKPSLPTEQLSLGDLKRWDAELLFTILAVTYEAPSAATVIIQQTVDSFRDFYKDTKFEADINIPPTSTFYRKLSRLKDLGFLQITETASDRRAIHYTLTDSGKAVIARLIQKVTRYEAVHGESVPPEDSTSHR